MSLTASHRVHQPLIAYALYLYSRSSPAREINDRLCLSALLTSKMVQATVQAYNAIEGTSMKATQLRTRTLSQISLSIPFKAMQTLGIDNFDKHRFTESRTHAKAYGPGQDAFETEMKR